MTVDELDTWGGHAYAMLSPSFSVFVALTFTPCRNFRKNRCIGYDKLGWRILPGLH